MRDRAIDQLSISIVVPVRNEGAFIGKTIQSLLDQDYDSERVEIIVVDGMSTDQTRDVVRRLREENANIRLFDNPKLLSSAGRNIGCVQSRGEVVVIVDGHCEIRSDKYLSNLASAFLESRADIVGRPQSLRVHGATLLQQAIAIARASRLGHHPDSFIYSSKNKFVPASSVGAAYRRDVFDRIGLFDESFDACEDVELNTRADAAGERCYFAEEAGIRYFPRSTLRGLFQQMSRYGRGRVRLARKHPRTLSLKSFIPGCFVFGLLTGPLFASVHSSFAIAYFTSIAMYVVLVLATAVWHAVRHRSVHAVFLLPPVFAAIHVGAGWGIIVEFLFGKRVLSD